MAERRGHSGAIADGGIGRVRGPGVRAGIVTAALILAVGGCTGTPRPEPSTRGTPGTPGTVITASPTSSATAAPIQGPARPAAMDRTDADGAMAAATYFIALYSYAYATGDLAAWTAMSDPACVFCRSVHDDVAAASQSGERSEGGLVTIVGAAMAIPGSDAATYRVDASIHQAAYRVLDRTGDVINEQPGHAGQMGIALATALPNGWRITRVNTERGK